MMFIRQPKIFLTVLFSLWVLVTNVNAEDTSAKNLLPVDVVFETSMGSFTLELTPGKAPETVANFLIYVDEGFYNNTLFHRVIPGFVVQGGGFEKGMKIKLTHPSIKNESDNGLMNIRGAISMARTRNPQSATSQFFINVTHNPTLDGRGKRPGYAVFGKVTAGMEIIDKIIAVPTKTSGPYKDVPKDDVFILSAKRKGVKVSKAGAIKDQQTGFVAGEHYIVLDKPVPTRDTKKVEVVQSFSYACSNCYEFEPAIREWSKQQTNDIDFWHFPAIWNNSMKLYAQAFYAAQALGITEKIHQSLFTAVVLEQKRISSIDELAGFFAEHGVDKKAFNKAYKSFEVQNKVNQAETQVSSYQLASVPEIIVNGKYRVDRMRAGGQKGMLKVIDYLVKKERALLGK